ALDVERINAAAEGKFDFPLGFADAGEGAFLRRPPGGNDAAQLAFADDVEPAAEIGERAQDREIGVGLDRVADQVIERRERSVELLEMVRQRALRIDVEWRAKLFDERFNRNA